LQASKKKKTYQTRYPQRTMKCFIYHLPLNRIDLRDIRRWTGRSVQFPDPEIVQGIVQNNPHDMIGCIARTRGNRLDSEINQWARYREQLNVLTDTKSHVPE
jgi:hypothetical protein